MSKNQKFFICKHCGNMVGLIDHKGVPLVCCGEEMEALIPNTREAATEKHIPMIDVTSSGLTVTVGSVEHPMLDAHHIAFIYVETERGGQRKCLKVGEKPQTKFSFLEDKPIAVYAYCNIHGLWKAEV